MRTKQNRVKTFILICVFANLFSAHQVSASDDVSIGTKIANDYSNFYAKERLMRMGAGFLSMGIIANSEIDVNLQDWYQDEVRSNTTDSYSKTAKFFGEGKYLLPISILASSAYHFNSESEIGNWGLNSARAYAVGLPTMWMMQKLTGASRPNESRGSKWRPLNDNNGVSGHAFVGAVPFLTLAQMNDNKFIKYALYATSTLTAWSRVNDNSHYTNQAILGWQMAYESVGSVFDTNEKSEKISFTPLIGNEYYGINISARW